MFDFCRKINKICPFSIESKRCGQGKGRSLIEDIKDCDGKTPRYSKKTLDRMKLERFSYGSNNYREKIKER